MKTLSYISKRWRVFSLLLLAYVPILLTKPGIVSADTKTYLFLNPSELLREASSLWSSSVGAGTVTHQYIGYLWPMGPYFWFTEQLGLPDWFSQRLWWGSLIFLASFGTYRLAQRIGITANIALVAALIYGFSPYSLHYLARLSGILLPWVGLPWLLLCIIRARQTPGWRWPALSALIIGTIGTVNATALFFVIAGVALWLLSDALTGLASWRLSITTFMKVGVGSVAVSLWWITSLVMQSSYGLPILRYSETYDTVAKTSLPQELLRGLGYWFFYGDEYGGRWIGPSAPYMTNTFIILAGFFVSAFGLISLATTNARYKVHLALFTLIGLAIAVGASPLTQSSWYGRIFETIVNNESGFALRSTPRALPLVLVGLAISTAYGLETLLRWRTMSSASSLFSNRRMAISVKYSVVVALICAVGLNNFPWFTQRTTTPLISRNENVPDYWVQAASSIDSLRDSTGYGRTYEFPASNFADYWWGGTVDPILPGMISSEYLAKEMIPQGSEATTDLLSAFESKLVDGRADVSVLSELAALFSANTITWRADLAYDHHLTARPEYLAQSLERFAPGETVFSGPVVPTGSRVAIVDESWFGNSVPQEYPLLRVWKVPQARPLLTQSSPSSTTFVVGSGEGVVNALSAKLLTSSDTFVYAGTLPFAPTVLQNITPSRLIVTDTNRKAERQWSSIAQQTGRTEQENETVSRKRPTDQRLNPFTDNYRVVPSTDQMTTSRLVGDIERVKASAYGHPVVLTPEFRPENIVDGDPRTTWVIGVRSPAIGEWIQIDLRTQVTASTVRLDFSQRQPGNRKLREGRIELFNSTGELVRSVPVNFDDEDIVQVDFPSTKFKSMRFTIDDESLRELVDYSTAPGIAIGEISLPGVSSSEYISLPKISTNLQQRSKATYFVLARQFVDPSIPHRSDSELNIQRAITVPKTSTVQLTGIASLSGRAVETTLQSELNLSHGSATQRLPGSSLSLGAYATDGDPRTAWTTPFDAVEGSQVNFSLSPANNSRQLYVHTKVDRFHSQPRRISVTDSSGTTSSYELTQNNATLTAELSSDTTFPLRSLTIDEIEPSTFPNYFTRMARTLPVAITEIDFGVTNPLRPPTLSTTCRNDLVFLNDSPVPVRLRAPEDILDTTQVITVESCAPLTLQSGENFIRTAKGIDIGIDINQLVLSPQTLNQLNTAVGGSTYVSPRITSRTTTRVTAEITTQSPQIVSFGQSINSGWKATLRTATETIDLGKPFVVQGYANGWLVPETGELVLEWSPQRFVRLSLAFSALSALALLLTTLRRPRRPQPVEKSELPQRTFAATWQFRTLCFGLLLAFTGIIPTILAGALLLVSRRWSAVLIATLITMTASVIVIQQSRFGYPPTLDWPLRFVDLTPVTWTAVALATINPLTRRH